MNKPHKRIFTLLLCTAVLLLSSCRIVITTGPDSGTSAAEPGGASPTPFPGNTGGKDPGAGSEAIPETSGSSEEEIDPYYFVTYRYAFSDTSLPEGSIGTGSVVFYRENEDGSTGIEEVPWEEVYAFEKQGARIPRTHYYDGEFPPEVRETLIPALDYSLAHGCFCFSLALIDVTFDKISAINAQLTKVFGISDKEYYGFYQYGDKIYERYKSIDIKLLSSKYYGGKCINCWRVNLLKVDSGAENGLQKYAAALKIANEAVDDMPAGLDEYGKALYLYKLVTENVRYADSAEEYLASPEGVSPLYDALVKRRCVCTGFADAIYCLFNLAGIECIKVASEVRDGDISLGAHVWNIARIDGVYYHFDATFDSGKSPGGYRCFGISTETVIKDFYRYPDGFWDKNIPECSKTLSEERGAAANT